MRSIFHAFRGLLLATLFFGAQGAIAAGPIQVTVGGKVYVLTSEGYTYTGNEALFQAQPWWGNPALAASITNAVQYQLEDYDGDPGVPDVPSALVGYGISGSDVSITYWDGTFQDCPSGCPDVADFYYYIFATEVRPVAVPALPLGGLLILAGLVGVAGLRRLRR